MSQGTFKVTGVPIVEINKLDIAHFKTHIETSDNKIVYVRGATKQPGTVMVNGVAHEVPENAFIIDEGGRHSDLSMFTILSRDHFSSVAA